MIGEITYYSLPPVDYEETSTIGQFYWAPIPFLFEKQIRFLKQDYYDEKNPSNSSFIIDKVAIENIRQIPPIPHLNVKDGEFIHILPWKLRPVIEVTDTLPNWRDYESSDGSCVIVAPLYSVNDDSGNCKFRQKFVQSVQAYQYPTLFYLPSDGNFGIRESLVRLDRLTILKRDSLLPFKIRLSVDGTFCFMNWLKYFLGCELDPIIDAYRTAAYSKIVGNSSPSEIN